MSLKNLLWLVMLISALACSSPSTVKIKGTVELENLDRMSFTRLIVSKNRVPVTDLKLVRPDFTLELEKNNLYTLTLSAPDHDILETLLWVTNENADITLKLGKIVHNVTTDPYVIGNFNGFNPQQAMPMERVTETTWKMELPVTNGELQYQLMGVTEDQRPVNGSEQDTFEYFGESPYFMSVFYSTDEKKDVTFNADISPSAFTSALTSSNASIQARAETYSVISANKKELTKAYINQYMTQSETLEIDWDVLVKPIEARWEMSTTKEDKAVVLAAFLDIFANGYTGEAPKDMSSVIFELGPMHEFWNLNQFYVYSVMELLPESEKNVAFLEEMSSKHLNPDVQEVATYAGFMAAEKVSDADKKLYFYNKLMNEFPKSQFVEYAKYQFDPSQKVVTGSLAPQFTVTSIDGKNSYSNSSFEGKYIMLDFWATWCGPCIQEMPELHEAYKEFKSDKFDILSLSFDDSADDVKGFRKDRFNMPWMHTFIEGGYENPLAVTYEVNSIPKPILIDPSGKIVAMGLQLRGVNLKKTLAKYLN